MIESGWAYFYGVIGMLSAFSAVLLYVMVTSPGPKS